MKVLQINCVYGYGSTGEITADIHRMLLSRGETSIVCYGRGKRSEQAGVIKLCGELYAKANNLRSRFRGIMYGGCFLSTWRLLRILKREKPDVVHLQCINGYFVNHYRLISWLKERKIKTVLTLHAEFPFTANCAHALDCTKWKTGCGNCPRLRQETLSFFLDGTASSFLNMKRSFSGFEEDLTVVSVSPWLQNRAMQSPILGKMHHKVILNGVDTSVFTYRPGSRAGGEWVILHVSAMFSDDPDHLKGGWFLLELAERLRDLPVRFLVAGKYRLKQPVGENVTLLGEIRERDALAKQYAAADLTLLTSKRETFSMVCAESLCCGTPVVGFAAGGPETVSLPDFSEFVPQGDLDALEAAVRRWMGHKMDKKQIAAAAATHYARETMLQAYWELYRGLDDETEKRHPAD